MKKVYFMAFAATVAMAMTSCSSEDLTAGTGTSNNEATAINFSTYLGRNVESRASETTKDGLTKIGVYASYTGSESWSASKSLDFMMNQEVTKSTETSSSSWSYSPLKYWPANETEQISFFAYAPYGDGNNVTLTKNTTDNGTTTAPTGAPVATFAITDATIAQTPDFVAACVMDQAKTTDSKVQFTLKHAMTRVAMQAKVNDEVYADGDAKKTKVVIKSVKLTGDELTTNAKYTLPNSTDANGKWEATGTTHAFGLSNVLKDDASGITGNSDKGAVLTGTTAASILKAIDYLYLIPANAGTGLSEAGKVKAEISYSIVTADDKLANKSVTTTATKTVALPINALAQGKSYTFTFTIGVNAIVLDVESVDEWGTDVTNTDINN